MAWPAGRTASLYYRYPHYASPRAAELDGARLRHKVAVVGAGPVGLACALGLARHGVASVVLEARTTVGEGSRAICLARHSFETFQQLGICAPFLAKALPWTHGTSYYRERPVYRLEMSHSEDERFYPMYNLQQQYIEEYLVAAAAASPLIELRWGHALDALQMAGDDVRLAVSSPAGSYAVQTQYVVAADGARSRVRQQLGLRLAGDAHPGRYVIVDIRLRSTYPTERRAFFDPPANPGGTVLVHKQPDDIWRIDYQLRDDEDETAALAEEAIRARVGTIVAMLGEHAPWELEWWSLYKAYTLCLDDYRHGPVLFAGDAAHLVPIFGVRGLNSGFADAADLGWKLAFVASGRADDALLDSYTPERRGATLDIFAQAGRSTRFMTPPTRGERRVREAVLSLAAQHPAARRLLDPRQSLPYTYAASPLSTRDESAPESAAGVRVGAALPNARLGDDEFLLDHLGREFTLLVFGDRALSAGSTHDCVAAAAARGVALHVLTLPTAGRAAQRCGTTAGGALLVRPDRHLCARWTTVTPAACERALARALALKGGT
ncbi:MAG: FAD-dependent monooxygenase [Gammaproteobacteria bacterium]